MPAALDEPTITATEIGPGHDGRPEVVVTLTYANGGTAQLSLDQEMVEQAVAVAGVSDLSQLTGRPWSILLVDEPDHAPTPARSIDRLVCLEDEAAVAPQGTTSSDHHAPNEVAEATLIKE